MLVQLPSPAPSSAGKRLCCQRGSLANGNGEALGLVYLGRLCPDTVQYALQCSPGSGR